MNTDFNLQRIPEIRRDVALADYTTFRIGGPAKYFCEAASRDEVAAALHFAGENGLEIFVLGGGSNVLVSDRGFEGLVLKIAIKGIEVMESTDPEVIVHAGAGEDWDEFVAFCVERELAGIECLSGIPGLVGGTPIQNVGAYGQEVCDTIVSVEALDRKTGGIEELSREQCGFGYRSSIFNSTMKGRYVVLSVKYALARGGDPLIVYADLRDKFGSSVPTLAETREAVREIRRQKGMLVRQGGPDSRSAGSFFKNPLVNAEEFRSIREKAVKLGAIAEGAEVPGYPQKDGSLKIPAAWLIEKAGFAKGYRLGNAGLSTVHTLALTNRGGANAAEMLALKDEIQSRVEKIWGVALVPEPGFVGFTESP